MSIMELENVVGRLTRRVKRLERLQLLRLPGHGSSSSVVQREVALIQEVVAEHFGISKKELLIWRKSRQVAFPRQVAMWLCRELLPRRMSFEEIGRQFGGRNHGTVMHACQLVLNVLEVKQVDTTTVLELRAKVESALKAESKSK